MASIRIVLQLSALGTLSIMECSSDCEGSRRQRLCDLSLVCLPWFTQVRYLVALEHVRIMEHLVSFLLQSPPSKFTGSSLVETQSTFAITGDARSPSPFEPRTREWPTQKWHAEGRRLR
ncbi:izh family channel protein [Moniliophthora roreri]|nr:izh family channel protein [Moniliophthora roreri]